MNRKWTGRRLLLPSEDCGMNVGAFLCELHISLFCVYVCGDVLANFCRSCARVFPKGRPCCCTMMVANLCGVGAETQVCYFQSWLTHRALVLRFWRVLRITASSPIRAMMKFVISSQLSARRFGADGLLICVVHDSQAIQQQQQQQ